MVWFLIGARPFSTNGNKMEKTEQRIPDWKTLIELHEEDL